MGKSKKRKLKYIRYKNNLRNGKDSFVMFQKVSQLDEGEAIKNSLIDEAKKCLMKKYRIDLPKHEFLIGQNGDDFLKNIVTVKIKLSLK